MRVNEALSTLIGLQHWWLQARRSITNHSDGVVDASRKKRFAVLPCVRSHCKPATSTTPGAALIFGGAECRQGLIEVRRANLTDLGSVQMGRDGRAVRRGATDQRQCLECLRSLVSCLTNPVDK